ncbi:hypothetical protein QU577_27040 [Priestia megaterium]|uniref:hypothetical protein n=1 Tax=Priestia megaterium TaxID=1404 RepID=UPI0025AF622D|nr:hypothetical protein [Priestia megaterium]MDN3365423.1 hypothetical protein [Priestia megaterium]
MTKEYALDLLETLIKGSNYSAQELLTENNLRLILEHACTVGYITESDKEKMLSVFQ